jgi:hypothetical protein
MMIDEHEFTVKLCNAGTKCNLKGDSADKNSQKSDITQNTKGKILKLMYI